MNTRTLALLCFLCLSSTLGARRSAATFAPSESSAPKNAPPEASAPQQVPQQAIQSVDQTPPPPSRPTAVELDNDEFAALVNQFATPEENTEEHGTTNNWIPAEAGMMSSNSKPTPPVPTPPPAVAPPTQKNADAGSQPSRSTVSAGTAAPASDTAAFVSTSLRNDTDLFPTADEKKEIYLNFEGAELKSFIEYIADIRKMNIIPDQSIAGNKISLHFRNPVSRSGAWTAFLTILEMANFSIVRVGNMYRVIPKDKKLKQPLPTFIGVDAETLPDSDITIRYVAFLNNIPIQEVRPLLQGMLGQPHGLIDQPNVNGFVITDRSLNIKSAMKVIQELDQTGLQETVYVMNLKRANAFDVKKLFDSLISKPDGGNPLARLLGKQAEKSTEFFAPSTKMIVNERTNSLIMLGTRESLEKVRKFIVEHIDTDLQQAKSPLRIYELQHTYAEEMVNILREVTSPANIQSSAGQQAAKHGAIRGGTKYFKSMTFQADKEGNRLLVSCTDDHDWKLLQETIRSIDTPQPQVAIQMMIVSVSAKDVKELGGQLRNKTHNMIGKNVDFQTHAINSTVLEVDPDDDNTPISLLGNLLNAITLNRGSTVLSVGKAMAGENGLWAIFKALSTKTNATILEQPFLTAANRSSSTIKVGESTYITTQEAVGASGSSSSGRTQEHADTTITITPQINAEGIIRLDLDASIQEFVPDTGGTSKQVKDLKTSVTMANGQVLAVGGFVKTKITELGGETPILSKIPIFGWFAKNKKRNIEKEYVFLFLCPTILKPRSTPGIGMYTKMKLHGATKGVEQAIEVRKTNDPIHDWFFNPTGEGYSHKVIDFANARYQPNNVDVRYDPYYRSATTQDSSNKLNIGAPSASPTTHWIEYNKKADDVAPAQEVSAPTTTTASVANAPPAKMVTVPTKADSTPTPVQKFVPAPPATQPVGPEKVTLETPLEMTPTPAAQHAPVTTLEDSIMQKRARLKNLLGGASLGEALNRKAAVTKPEQETTHTKAPQQAQPSNSDSSLMLSRRNGIKNLLAAGPTQSSPNMLLSDASQSRGLQNFLKGA